MILILIRLLISLEHLHDGLEDDVDVQPEAPVLDVPDVAADAAFHLLDCAGLAAVAGDLAPAGDAGLDVVADHVLVYEVGVFFGVPYHVGTGTYDAHLPEQHVDELRELVYAGVAQYLAPPGDTGVAPSGLQGVGLGVDLHAAELDAGELLAVEAGALLQEEHGPGHGQLRHYRHHYEYRNEQGAEEEQREHYVERPLDGAVALPAQGFLVQAQAGNAAHHGEVHLVVDVVAHVGHAVEAHQMVLAVLDYGEYSLRLLRGEAAVEAADVGAVFLQIRDHPVRRSEVAAALGELRVRLEVEVSAHPVAYRRVSGQLVVERGVVHRAADEHHAVPPPPVHPVMFDDGSRHEAENQDYGEHGQYAQRIHSPRRHREMPEIQYGSRDDGEPEHVVQHDLDDLRAFGLLAVQHYSAVRDAGVVDRADDDVRLERGRAACRPEEAERKEENKIAEQKVADGHDKPYPGVVLASVVNNSHGIAFSCYTTCINSDKVSFLCRSVPSNSYHPALRSFSAFFLASGP